MLDIPKDISSLTTFRRPGDLMNSSLATQDLIASLKMPLK